MSKAIKNSDVVTFSQNLKRSNSTIREDRANRMGTLVQMSYKSKVDDLKKQLIYAEADLDNLIDLSASNVKTTVNRVDKDTFDSDNFVESRMELKLKIHDLQYQLEVLTNDEEFYS